MSGHDHVRQQRLRGQLAKKSREFGDDAIRSEVGQELRLGVAQCFGPFVGKVHDLALGMAVDRAVRIVNEALEVFGMPGVAAGMLAVATYALMNNDLCLVVGHEESIEAILDGGTVDLGDESARTRRQQAVKTDPLCE